MRRVRDVGQIERVLMQIKDLPQTMLGSAG